MGRRKTGRAVRVTRASVEAERKGPELVRYARTVIDAEAKAIGSLEIGRSFVRAVGWILACKGHVVVTGMGKPGFVAQKLSATFASTGTPSLYVHPAEAAHGDLGRIAKDDLVLALSNSGETEEILRLIPSFRRIGVRVVAMTADSENPLALAADLTLTIGAIDEACPMGLAPTASTAALLALGDALAMTVLKNRSFAREEYAFFHPAGKLGRDLMKVKEVMRQGKANPVVRESARLSEAVAVMTETPGRPGAASVVDVKKRLVGIFTDGDLRRLVERGETNFKVAVAKWMCRNPRTVRPDALVADAARVLREARVDQVPVIDDKGRPVGLLDVQDLLAVRVI